MSHLPRQLYHVAGGAAALVLGIFGLSDPFRGAISAQDQVPQFSTGVQLVEVYATVTDARGEPLMGLQQSDFEVYENDQKQTISTFTAGEFPATVVLGVDRSFSMAGEPLRLAKLASQTFLRQLRPTDRSMVVAISNEAEVVAPMSTDRPSQIQAIAALDAWSSTALYDTIVTTLERLEGEPGRQALVVFSDGTDRYSHATEGNVLERARSSHALIYPIMFGKNQKNRPPIYAELAAVTGGRSFFLRDARELDTTLSAIAKEIRYQYLLGYTPSRTIARGREWRALRVSVRNQAAGVRVRARDGYIAQ